MTLSPNELIGLITAIAGLLGALGYGAVRNSKKETNVSAIKVFTVEDGQRVSMELSGLIRALHQEVRLDHRDTRDRLVRLEERLARLK